VDDNIQLAVTGTGGRGRRPSRLGWPADPRIDGETWWGNISPPRNDNPPSAGPPLGEDTSTPISPDLPMNRVRPSANGRPSSDADPSSAERPSSLDMAAPSNSHSPTNSGTARANTSLQSNPNMPATDMTPGPDTPSPSHSAVAVNDQSDSPPTAVGTTRGHSNGAPVLDPPRPRRPRCGRVACTNAFSCSGGPARMNTGSTSGCLCAATLSGGAGLYRAACGNKLPRRSLGQEAPPPEARNSTTIAAALPDQAASAVTGELAKNDTRATTMTGDAVNLPPLPPPLRSTSPSSAACPCNCTYVSTKCCTSEAAKGIVIEPPQYKLGSLLPPTGWCCNAQTGEFSPLPEGRTLLPDESMC
jgi:hypothetical protein